jgi:cytochrome bd ubiquinol oxidase subunit II
VTPADLLGAVILVALVAYALLGGADFGAGIWDLLASGPRRREQRTAIEHAIGPIWEANHVWLILVVVVLFTAFPAAFAAISIALFAPLVLLLVGIVLRGAAFTFRTYDRADAGQQRWGLLFSASSVLAPAMLGVVVGALASGRLRAGEGEPPSSPLAAVSAFTLGTGAFTCALFAFLAAAYLTVEVEGELREDFRRRAIASGVAVFVCAAAVAGFSWRHAPLIFHGLTARPFSMPLHVVTAACAVTAFLALFGRRYRLARSAAALQVALIVAGWGLSQYPYLVVPQVTLASASAPRATQVLLLVALAAGALTLFPSLYLLFRVFKGERPFSVLDRRPAERPPRRPSP